MNARPAQGGYQAVVIGASAGGVQALLRIFAALPASFSLPVIMVLHLPEEPHSHLAEVFARCLHRPFKEAQDKEDIKPGMFYFAGPRYHLSVEKDLSLSLSQEERVHYSRPSIDVLFESAADAYGPGLIGVLLTGANEDGAKGLATIHRCKGLTLVQDPAEARVAITPQAALKLQRPDHILPLNGIGLLLAELERSTC